MEPKLVRCICISIKNCKKNRLPAKFFGLLNDEKPPLTACATVFVFVPKDGRPLYNAKL
jgi:hypothetical protein